MTISPILLAITLLASGAGSPGASDDSEGSQVEAVATNEGYATGIQQDEHEAQKSVSRATGDAGESGTPSPQVGVWIPPVSGAEPEEEQTGPLVCMVIDDGPQVAWMPSCDEIVPEPEEDEDTDEDEDAPEDEESEPIIITVTRSDFAELPLELPTVHLQPERDWFLANMDTLAYTDGAPQMLETTVLDVPVRVRATPVEFSWDFGDGSAPLVTTVAGAPWPADDISHVYQREAEDLAITLTTTWSGEFQVAGQGPWIPIAGTTSTQSQSAPFHVDAVETRLVADD